MSTESDKSSYHSVEIRDINLQTNLLDMLKTFVEDKNLKVDISNKSVYILKMLLECMPDIFNKIGSDISEICEDRILDVHDIPIILNLISNIFNINTKSLANLKITKKDVINVIETIIFILIDQNIIKTGENKNTCLIILKASCVVLNIDISVPKKSWWSCM